ncbi:MAG: hypothetical protein ABEL97_02235, partial [Salinibacter sp.]
LMRGRVRVEVEYVIALADLEATPLAIDADLRERLRATYPRRRELRCFSVPEAGVPPGCRAAVADGLTMQGRAPGR